MHSPLNGLLSVRRSGASIASCAKTAGCSVGSWHAWEHGTALPSRMAIPSLAAALGIPADELAALVARERARRVVGRGRRSSCPDSTTRARRRPGRVVRKSARGRWRA
jgi:transcriptional regulator with XRE-family HTH domain